jgi:hypothetical protein
MAETISTRNFRAGVAKKKEKHSTGGRVFVELRLKN